MKRIVLLALLVCGIVSCTLELDGNTIHIKKKPWKRTKPDTTKIKIDTTKDESWKEISINN
jgi:hypothetical protein